MVSCDTVRSMLSELLEGTIDPENKRQIEAHLEVCADCRQTAGNIRLITSRLHSVATLSTSAGFDQALRLKIMSSPDNSETVFSFRNLSYAFSAAVIIIAAYFIFWTDVPDAQNIRPVMQQSNQITTSSMTVGGSDIAKPVAEENGTLSTRDSVNNEPASVDQENIKLVDQ